MRPKVKEETASPAAAAEILRSVLMKPVRLGRPWSTTEIPICETSATPRIRQGPARARVSPAPAPTSANSTAQARASESLRGRGDAHDTVDDRAAAGDAEDRERPLGEI